MKHTNRFLTATTLLILTAVAVYTVAYIWCSIHTIRTATAIAETVQRMGHTEGILVRDELVIDGGDGVTVIVAEDGERVAAGSTLAFSGTRITATCSGIFLSQLDGYEHLSATALEQFTPFRLALLTNSRNTIDETSPGKLIPTSLWYYAGVLPETDATLLSVGDSITMVFSDTLSVVVSVDQISSADNGVCAIVCSSEEQILPLLQLRCVQASILLDEYDGFTVPQAAVFVDTNGQTCLYTVVGGIADCVQVQILYTDSEAETVLVSPLESGKLYHGSPVLLQHDKIYDGMVLS